MYTEAEDYERNTPLHLAVKFGHLDIVKLLIEKLKVNPNPLNDNLDRPIAYSTNTEITEYLQKFVGEEYSE